MTGITHPFYPIVYVRGYAMTEAEIREATVNPYMGFNTGSTKVRQDWAGAVKRHVFESPLIRLMKDYGYVDNFREGTEITGTLPSRSLVTYRYYEQADPDIGQGSVPSIEAAAEGLRDLILEVKQQICGDDAEAHKKFRLYLVAHSMGGLICRCFLQYAKLDDKGTRALIDKVFTYASPHNGIDVGGINVPAFLKLWDINNFNRNRIREYLSLPKDATSVSSLNGSFEPARFFSLVGTNNRDYDAAGGLSKRLAGELSDGLVRIENAAVDGSPRAFVNRSHSGHYGIVNSEEGYQNLTRFLFGDKQINGILEVKKLPLPPSIQRAYNEDKQVRASYYFEATVSPRGGSLYALTTRRKDTNSAVLRSFDELFRLENVDGLKKARSPFLFSVFLDSAQIKAGRTIVFSIDLAVSTTEYEIDNRLFDKSIPGEYLYRNTVTVRVSNTKDGVAVKYGLTDDSWGETAQRKATQDGDDFVISLSSQKGFEADLRLDVSAWNNQG